MCSGESNIVSVLPALVRIHDPQQRRGVVIHAAADAVPLERVGEVVGLRVHLDMAGQGREPSERDHDQDDHLEDAEDVEQPHSPFREQRVHQAGERHAGYRDVARGPAVWFSRTRGEKNVSAERERVAG